MAIQDSGSKYIRAALGQLKRIGGRVFKFGYRGSYVLAGYTGGGRRPYWVKEVQNKRGKGPTLLTVAVRPPKISGTKFIIALFLKTRMTLCMMTSQ